MERSKYPRGSEWRKWDLHVHTPISNHYTGDFKQLIQNLKKTDCSVIGINDYASIDGYEKLKEMIKDTHPILFPVVEFRMHNIIANRKGIKAGTKINFHVIFNNDEKLFAKIKNFLNSIECYNEKGDTDQLGNIKSEHLNKITVDFEKVIQKLNELKIRRDALIWLPYDEYGGIDDIDPSDNFFKLGLIRKTDLMGSASQNQIGFFSWKDKKYSERQYKEWFDSRKACIKGSDAHEANYPFGSLKNEKSEPINKYCWIKADPTFEGLKQIIYEPERVYIGVSPDKLEYCKNNKELFIDTLEINSIENNDEWFDQIKYSIPFNTGLVSIIGNKGHGKSALADIISSLSNAKQEEYSFLSQDRFLGFERVNKYSACIKFIEAYENEKKLSEVGYDPHKKVKLKYLSQHFVNTICEDINSSYLQEEINKVVFSHLPEEIQSDYDDINKLVNSKVQSIENSLERERKQLSKINIEIAESERSLSDSEIKKLENLLDSKKKEIEAHKKEKPKKVNKPKESKKIDELSGKLEKVEKELTDIQKKITILTKEKNELAAINESFKNIEENIEELYDDFEANSTLKKYRLNIKTIFTYRFNYSRMNEKIKLIESKIKTEEKNRKEKREKRVQLKAEIDEINKTASAQQKKYSNYIKANHEWNAKKKELRGAKHKEGTFLYYEDRLNYIKKDLPSQIVEQNNKRTKRITKIVDLLFQKQNIIPEIFKSAQDYADERAKEFEISQNEFISFDSKIKLRDSFFDDVYDLIDGTRYGSYYHDSNRSILKQIVGKGSLKSKDDLLKLSDELEKSFKYNFQKEEEERDALGYEKIIYQLRNKELHEIYDFIYSFDYIDSEFDITYGGKNIKELSPGERGTLLLIFYLLIDLDKNPLIIDQPEENLDNETIFQKLVPFIKKVKEERQVIIVTHNPNLAIVCDSEQIIHAHIDKKNNNLVSYNSGSIEYHGIRDKAIAVLEGTEPAFINRKNKYHL